MWFLYQWQGFPVVHHHWSVSWHFVMRAQVWYAASLRLHHNRGLSSFSAEHMYSKSIVSCSVQFFVAFFLPKQCEVTVLIFQEKKY
jgi:hypothetical protein